MNRKLRRKMLLALKKYKDGANSDSQDLVYYFQEGEKVRINAKKITKGNSKRVKWVMENANKIFTIEYEKKWGDKPMIYCLKEDETDPKWYFSYFELEKV